MSWGFIFSFPFASELVLGSFRAAPARLLRSSPGLSAQARGCLEVGWIRLDSQATGVVPGVLCAGIGIGRAGLEKPFREKIGGNFPFKAALGQLEAFSSSGAGATPEGFSTGSFQEILGDY